MPSSSQGPLGTSRAGQACGESHPRARAVPAAGSHGRDLIAPAAPEDHDRRDRAPCGSGERADGAGRGAARVPVAPSPALPRARALRDPLADIGQYRPRR